MIHYGKVVVYSQAKSWGFIEEQPGERWFFHLSNAVPKFVPKLGLAVEFEIGPPLALGKKDQAVNVCYASRGLR